MESGAASSTSRKIITDSLSDATIMSVADLMWMLKWKIYESFFLLIIVALLIHFFIVQ